MLVPLEKIPKTDAGRGPVRRGPHVRDQQRDLGDGRASARRSTTSGAVRLQGGSTITQQYVKNAYSERQRPLLHAARLHEFFISLKAARELSKDQILENYLNMIYFGRGCYGVEAASQCYFGKHVKQAHARARPRTSPASSTARSSTTPATAVLRRPRPRRAGATSLDGMVTEGWLSRADAQAKQKFPKIQPKHAGRAARSAGNQRGYLHGHGPGRGARSWGSSSRRPAAEAATGSTRRSGRAWSHDAKTRVTDGAGPAQGRGRRAPRSAIATIDDEDRCRRVDLRRGRRARRRTRVTQDIMQAGLDLQAVRADRGARGQAAEGRLQPPRRRTTPA